jgi:hypothetical protein
VSTAPPAPEKFSKSFQAYLDTRLILEDLMKADDGKKVTPHRFGDRLGKIIKDFSLPREHVLSVKNALLTKFRG